MTRYENKSFEELRCEDYIDNRKGPQQQSAGSLFGGAKTTGLFGSSKFYYIFMNYFTIFSNNTTTTSCIESIWHKSIE
jgi:hypothetical protein